MPICTYSIEVPDHVAIVDVRVPNSELPITPLILISVVECSLQDLKAKGHNKFNNTAWFYR